MYISKQFLTDKQSGYFPDYAMANYADDRSGLDFK